MLRFAGLLASGLRSNAATVEILAPKPILLGKRLVACSGLLKWIGYIDKWILFPIQLRRTVRQRRREFGDGIHYHVCDHSNAPYLAYLPVHRTAITCHDVLAIRGALGYPATYCPASPTGVILQRWILKHLRNARRIACVSNLTLKHLCEVAGVNSPKPDWMIVHNALNADFARIDQPEAGTILKRQGYHFPKPFLLHVGSNALRKNRMMLLQMIKVAGARWQGDVCFAGEPVDEGMREKGRELRISDRIYSVPNPDHGTLCALYSTAYAFVFPSFSEGFGWPLTEAQSCGTPVIASNLEPLMEISGGAAIHADPHDAESFAAGLLALEDAGLRESLITRGLNNAGRFVLSSMVNKYLALHGLGSRTDNYSAVLADVS